MENIMDTILPASLEAMRLEQKNKRAELLLSMQFIQKYGFFDNFAKFIIDRKVPETILYEIAEFYEPIAMYLEKPKKRNLGIFGIEFDKDDLSIFLNSIGTDKERLILLITGHIINNRLLEIDQQLEKVLREPNDLTIVEHLLKVDENINSAILDSEKTGEPNDLLSVKHLLKVDKDTNGSILDPEKIWLAYFYHLNARYVQIKKKREYVSELCENIKSFVRRHNDTENEVSDEAENDIGDLANSVLEYLGKNNDNAKDVLECIYKIFNTLDDAFLEEVDTLLDAKLFPFIRTTEREASNILHKLLAFRDPCNTKEIGAKEVAELFIDARETMLEKSIFEKYSEDSLLFSKFDTSEKKIIESALFAYFKCTPDRMTTLEKEIVQAIEKDDERSIIENMESAISKLLGEGAIEIKSEREGLLLLEAIEQFLKTVREKIILPKNENSSEMEKQFNHAKDTLEIFLRRSGRFDLADRIHNEDYIKPDTIKNYALRWKEYWKYRINKLSGANTRRTQNILTGIEKRVRAIVEKEQTNMGVDPSTKKKLNMCVSQNIPYEEFYKKLTDLDDDI